MKKREKHLLMNFCSLVGILFLLVLKPAESTPQESPSSAPFSLGTYAALALEEEPLPEGPIVRVARRLSLRIARGQGTSPPLSVLIHALTEQQLLMKQHTTVTLQTPTNPAYRTWEVSLNAYPSWMRAKISPSSAQFAISPRAIAEYLDRETIDGIVKPVPTTILSIYEQDGVIRATTDGVAQSGLIFENPTTPVILAQALEGGTTELTLSLIPQGGHIENTTAENLGDLTLLGTGRSDFRGSPSNRISNIHKALREHINNVLVPPGATFSFNATLGGPITESHGWQDAKVIFNTTELRMAPGGGICQASTTVFRAMLDAGFQAIERENHSMYVSYYEKYGVGIDATVFPGLQDLTFVNDTDDYILLQAYDEGTEAIVNIYGTPDGRTIEIRGPYFFSSDFSDYPLDKPRPRKNEISWIQHVSLPDGTTQENIIISRYTALPLSLPGKYALHASALETGSLARAE
jgi:hypothetical protein